MTTQIAVRRPNPQQRPDRVQREQAHPACNVQHILVWMIALDGDLVGYVVDRNDAVEQHQRNEDKQDQRDVFEHDDSPFLRAF